MNLSMFWKLHQELLVPKILIHFSVNFALFLDKNVRKQQQQNVPEKWSVKENIKYFTRPLRVDNYKSRLKFRVHIHIFQHE